MKLVKSLIFISAVVCFFDGNAAAPSAGDAFISPHIMGDSPWDRQGVQPLVADLLLKDGMAKITRTCGATLVNANSDHAYFLTAAECLERNNSESLSLRYYSNGEARESYIFSVHTIHPEYNPTTKANNIGIFYAPNRFEEGPAILIKEEGNVPSNEKAEVFAWRNTNQNEDSKESYELYSIKTKVISSKWCKFLYPFSSLKENRICASGWFRQGLNSKDDIGRALLQRDPDVPNRYWLLGIATIVRPWAPHVLFPMEILNVASYKAWIESVFLT